MKVNIVNLYSKLTSLLEQKKRLIPITIDLSQDPTRKKKYEQLGVARYSQQFKIPALYYNALWRNLSISISYPSLSNLIEAVGKIVVYQKFFNRPGKMIYCLEKI